METTFETAPAQNGYYQIRYVTRNSRGEIQMVGSASTKRFESEAEAAKAAKRLAEGN